MVLSMSASLTWCVKSCCYQRNCALMSSSYRRWTWWRCLLDIEKTGLNLRPVTVHNNKSTWEGDWSRVWFMNKSLFSKWIVFVHMHRLVLIWCDVAYIYRVLRLTMAWANRTGARAMNEHFIDCTYRTNTSPSLFHLSLCKDRSGTERGTKRGSADRLPIVTSQEDIVYSILFKIRWERRQKKYECLKMTTIQN